MKRVLLIFTGLLVLLVAVAVVAPSFIDWNQYKSEIAGPIERATGRKLTMNGDLSLSVLPTPRVSVADVHLSTPGGETDFLTLRALDVQVALWPLIRGEIQVISVRLVEPEFFLEVAADGSNNWQFGTGTTGSSDVSSSAPISVERVVVANGALNYADAATGQAERIEAITATFTAANLAEGPYAAEGRFSIRKQAVGFDVSLGAAGRANAMPLRAKLELERGGAAASVQGSITPFSDTPLIDANLSFDGGDLREALSVITKIVGSNTTLVVPGAQGFSITAQITGSADAVSINDLAMVVGETRATGAVSASFGTPLVLDVTLSLGRIDLDAWANAVSIKTSEGAAAAPSAALTQKTNPLDALTGITATLNLTGDALTYRGSLVRQFRLAASVVDRAFDLSAFNAILPGGSDISISGRVATVEGQPRFDGTLELASADFRAAAAWLGVTLEGLAPGRLRQLSLQSQVRATRELGQLFGIDLRLDSSRITGGLAYAFRARPSFSVDLQVDRLDLDPYLGADTGTLESGDDIADSVPPAGTSALAFLDTFDTNTKLAVDSLTFGGRRYVGVSLDASLLAGAMTLRNAAIINAGGAAIVLSGSAGNFAAVPAFDTRIAVQAADVAVPAHFFGVDLPVDVRALGAVDLTGRVIGSAADLAIDLVSEIGDMTASVNGRLELLAAAPRIDMQVSLGSPSFVRATQLAGIAITPTERTFDGPLTIAAELRGNQETINVKIDIAAAALTLAISGAFDNPITAPAFNIKVQLSHPDMNQLLRAVGIDYQPVSGNLGAVRTLADIAGRPGAITISHIEGALGPVGFAGDATANFEGPRPRIDARFNAGEILADLFLPASNTVSGGTSGNGAARTPVQGVNRWSKVPINLSVLQAFDGSLALGARGLTYGNYALKDPTVVANLENGTLTIDPLSARLFDGDAVVRLTAVADPVARLGVSVALDGANIEQAMQSSAGLDSVTGLFNMRGEFTTTGQSQRDLVDNLSGNFSFAAQDGVVRGINLPSLSDRLGNLNEALDFFDLLQRTFEGGETSYKVFQGSFQVEDGVARSTDLTAALDAAAGTGTAVVDLPRWRLDMRTIARLIEHPDSPGVGLDITGPLDNPQRSIRTQALEQYITQRVGSTLIRKLLRVDGDTPVATEPSAAQSRDSRIPSLPGEGRTVGKAKPATREDLFKGIIRRLGDR